MYFLYKCCSNEIHHCCCQKKPKTSLFSFVVWFGLFLYISNKFVEVYDENKIIQEKKELPTKTGYCNQIELKEFNKNKAKQITFQISVKKVIHKIGQDFHILSSMIFDKKEENQIE